MTKFSGMPPNGGSSVASAGHYSAVSNGSVTAPDKWYLLRTVEAARVPLGLKSTSLTLLRAMLSFMRSDRVSPAKVDAHICFASNASLAERAHVSVQTVERHISRLVDLGLVERVCSGNGKRWARRDRKGRVVLASGLSVLPMLDRHQELSDIAEEHAVFAERLRTLRDRCALALANVKNTMGLSKDDTFYQHAARLLRRAPCEDALNELLKTLSGKVVDKPQDNDTDADKLMVPDTKVEGHKEPELNPSVSSTNTSDIHLDENTVKASFPTLCAEIRTAATQRECADRMEHIASCLGLTQIWPKLCAKGPAMSFLLLGYILERGDKVRNARRYALALVRDIENGSLNWRQLLSQTIHSPRSKFAA
ncbi:hypothetical protein GCM10022290_11510 [Sagittula marina]